MSARSDRSLKSADWHRALTKEGFLRTLNFHESGGAVTVTEFASGFAGLQVVAEWNGHFMTIVEDFL